MMDVGLLASMVIMLAVPAVFLRPWPASALSSSIFDTSIGALLVGLLVGRATSLALDDPHSLTSLSDFLVIRSGVEFWPGLFAGIAWLAVGARRGDAAASTRLAALASAGLVAWACFEATCLLRDGCPGPASPVGLHPDGLVTPMFPVGLAVAVAALGGAAFVEWLRRRHLPDIQVLAVAIAVTAAIRAIASIWLPHVGSGLTRQHQTSIAIVIAALATIVGLRTGQRLRQRLAVAR